MRKQKLQCSLSSKFSIDLDKSLCAAMTCGLFGLTLFSSCFLLFADKYSLERTQFR